MIDAAQPYFPDLPNNDTISSILDSLRVTDWFTSNEIEWVESILTRQDGQDGSQQLSDLLDFVELHKDVSQVSAWEKHKRKVVARRKLWSAQVMGYKQRHVLVGVPQRKQHPKWPAPNLSNLSGVQACRVDVQPVYGLGYVEARLHLVRSALAAPSVTHLLFVDDDIRIPQDTLTRLLQANLPIVSGLYCKKNPQIETVATTIVNDPKYIFGNTEVPCEQGNFNPVPVGCCGGGMLLIETEVFKRMPEPWFEFIIQKSPDGTKGKVLVGEDSYFVQKASAFGIKTAVLPGLVGVHVDFVTGDEFGPHWLVDPETRRLRPEFRDKYTKFPDGLPLRDLLAADNGADVFNKNQQLREAGLI